MRGEHCIAGASVLSFIAMVLVAFANIGQISSGALVNNIYMVELNLKSFGNGLKGAINKDPAGLYSNALTPMGHSQGLSQYYRYGLYNSCGYNNQGKGRCNSTIFGYPFEPVSQMVSDIPATSSAGNLKDQAVASIGKDAVSFKDNSWNHALSRAGSLLIFVGSCLTLFAFVFGLIKHRLSFFVAALCATISAFFLMIGAAIWTSVIAKDSGVLKKVKVTNGQPLGIYVNAGPSLYLTWVAFAFIALSVFPYVISCCTYRK
ncbi:hypothetical protein VHUM_00512 [Vanrija humicola]|uniref:Actin cortical patch SUR7/pH-response regulator PalI n=1 Tax=Vanrija humicola TaxID=5417 RepID=A0A7D8V5W1_VANHU|nr:hypothetical protein VHUM_00512 [Vanrija humicola]